MRAPILNEAAEGLWFLDQRCKVQVLCHPGPETAGQIVTGTGVLRPGVWLADGAHDGVGRARGDPAAAIKGIPTDRVG